MQRTWAVNEARVMLTQFAPPPGARPLAAAPGAGGLDRTTSFIGSQDLVIETAFWTAPGTPQAVLGWEASHLPTGYTPGDKDFGPPAWDQSFDLAPVSASFNGQSLVVKVAAAGDGQAGIRVDAEVSWTPLRASREQVPAATRAVQLSEARIPGIRYTRPLPVPVTITSPAVVRRLEALVDGLQVSTSPNGFCPEVANPNVFQLHLIFRASPGGAPLASVLAPQECATVSYANASGTQLAPLQLTDTFIADVLAAAGLHWQLAGSKPLAP